MGCSSSPVINYENSFNECTMTINNLPDELIKIFPSPSDCDCIIACSCHNYKVLDIKDEKEKDSYDFHYEIFNLILYDTPTISNLIEGGSKGDLIIHDLETKQIKVKAAHMATITCLLLLKNGNLLTASSDGFIYIWDPTQEYDEVMHFNAHKSIIWNICEIKKNLIISTSNEGISKMFSIKKEPNNRCVLVFNTPKCKCLQKFTNKRIVYNSSNDIIIYYIERIPDLSEEEEKIRIKKKHEPQFVIKDAHETPITYILTMKTGEIVSGGEDGIIKVFHDKYNFECTSVLTGHSKRINYIGVFFDDKLISCSDDKRIKMWERALFEKSKYKDY